MPCPTPIFTANRLFERTIYSGGVGNPILDESNVPYATAYNLDFPKVLRAMEAPTLSFTSPSLLRAADFMTDPYNLPWGTYYLYFANHKGGHIRMAYADDLQGPWTIYNDGNAVLRLSDNLDYMQRHVASPNVHWDPVAQQFVMYFHSELPLGPDVFEQRTFVATSADGLDFTLYDPDVAIAEDEVLGENYFAAFRYVGKPEGPYFALSTRGPIYESSSPLTGWTPGPAVFADIADFRHFGVRVVGDCLWVFYSIKEAIPEQILVKTIDLTLPFADWPASFDASPEEPVLTPSTVYENEIVLDPFVYSEDGRFSLLYSTDDEAGIAIAELLT